MIGKSLHKIGNHQFFLELYTVIYKKKKKRRWMKILKKRKYDSIDA